jgi:hypothetical protein
LGCDRIGGGEQQHRFECAGDDDGYREKRGRRRLGVKRRKEERREKRRRGEKEEKRIGGRTGKRKKTNNYSKNITFSYVYIGHFTNSQQFQKVSLPNTLSLLLVLTTLSKSQFTKHQAALFYSHLFSQHSYSQL